jgi:MSHA biogenesis protein MshL
MLKKWIVFVFVAAFMLSACNSPVYNQTENNVADVKIKTKAARQKSDDSAKVASSLVMDKGLYVDKTPISLYRNPSWLKDHIVIKGDQLPFSYYSRSLAQGAGYGILTKYQVGMDQTTRVSMNYSGTVQGALDLLASKAGYVYSIEGKTIYWQAFLTKTYDIAFMPGGSDYLMGKKSGSGGAAGGGAASAQNFTTSDSSADQFSNIGGKLSVWTDLQTTLNQLISPEGKATVSQATTSVTVRDRPSNLALVSQYIANLNSKLSRQVLVKIQILQVDLRNDYEMGINWQIIAKSFHNSPFVLNGNYGTPISITNFVSQSALPSAISGTTGAPTVPQFGTIGNGGIPSYTILFNALNQQGKASVVTEPRVVALNNQVSVINITEQKGYVASIQNTALAPTGAATTTAAQNTVTSQVTPGNIITGITLYILPKIMNNKIYMQVNADLSVNTDIQTFGPAGSQIQLPTVASKSFNQRGVIRSGETMILSGFRQLVNNARATQLMKSQALGGKASVQTSSETVVLITPIILEGAV